MKHTTPFPASTLSSRPFRTRWHPRLDRVGAWLAMGCAVHCVTLPLLLAFVPASMLALQSWSHPAHGVMTALLTMSRWEWAFAVLASTVALSSTVLGWRRHCCGSPMALAVMGGALLLSASLYVPLKESIVWHGVATLAGGALLATAHLRNRRLSRQALR